MYKMAGIGSAYMRNVGGNQEKCVMAARQLNFKHGYNKSFKINWLYQNDGCRYTG